jgi:uncharacterized membrane protein YccF (DUF307 family)
VIRTLGNLIWLVLGGLAAAFVYFLAGVLLVLPVVTIPLAVQAFKLARYAAWPFGARLVSGLTSPFHGVVAVVANVLWFPFGVVLSLVHLTGAVASAITIIGIPFAWAHLKLAGVALIPFGFRVVDVSELTAGTDTFVVRPVG